MRKTLLLWFSLTLAAVALLVLVAQPLERKSKTTIGVVLYTDTNLSTLEGFKRGLAELGIDESSARFIFDGPARSPAELDQKVRTLLEEQPDLIFASPTPAALAAKRATSGSAIPVVFAPVNDPVAAGVVSNLRAPEGNLTGVRLAQSDDMRLQSLLDVAPDARVVLIPFNAADPSALASLKVTSEAASRMGVRLVAQPFTFEPGTALGESWDLETTQAVFLPRDGLVMSHIDEFVAMCLKRKLPLSTPRVNQVESGALTGYGFVGEEVGRQAARLAHALLSGTPVSELPVETARDWLFLNLETARRIDRSIPPAVVRRAKYVFYEIPGAVTSGQEGAQ